MRRLLLFLACLLGVGTLGLWMATGAHSGWTRTSVAIEKVDEITGLTYREYEKRWVIGVEVLGAGLGAALGLGGVSWFLGRRSRGPGGRR